MKRRALACLFFGAASIAASASAQEIEHYTVVEGDTCGTIAERYYGSPRRYDRIHEHNPDLGPMPHHLHAGQVLEIPLPREQGSAATLTDARGSVHAARPGSDSMTTAHIGEGLDTGGRVGTGERSSAELTFRSTTVAAIREQTLVIVHGTSVEHVREEGGHAELREGSLLSRLSSLSGGAALRVDTPSSEVDLHQGEASVSVTGGDTSVSVHSGSTASVRAQDQSVDVPSGHGTVVHRGRPPTPPRPLPAPPSWASGESRTFLGDASTGATLHGSWLAVEHASAYRVEIARREDGRDLVFSAQVDPTVTHFEAYHFPAGAYFVRVASVDADRLEGRPASPERFEVVPVRFLAPGEVAPAPGTTPVDVLEELDALADAAMFASAAPPPPEALRGARVVVPDGVVCAMGASEPSHELMLETIGNAFLTCVDAAGSNIAGMNVTVIGLRATIERDGGELGALTRGTSVPISIVLGFGAPDASSLRATADGGVDVTDVTPMDGRLGATLVIAPTASESATITLAASTAPELALATLTVHTVDPPPPPPPPAPPPPPTRSFAVHEAFGAFPNASWVGLRDEQRTGVGGTVGMMVQSARLGEHDPRVRMAIAATAGLFDDYLRIGVAAPLDVMGQSARTADLGARDLFVSLGSRLLNAAQTGGIGLALDVGLWAPTAGASGLNRGRLQFAADFSVRIADRVALRTRQAGIFDLASSGSMLWASAYGVDVRIVDPLSIGLEGTTTIGHEDGADWYAGGVGLALGLDCRPVFLSLAGRYGFGDDLWPSMTIALSARAAFDP
jgi:hypothetical protein